MGELQRAAGAAERLLELLNAHSDVRPPERPRPQPGNASGEVIFDRVTFRYPAAPDRSALQDFSLHVRAGAPVALGGSSGAGQTTVFRLLSRFYVTRAGVVHLDGVAVAEDDP